MTDKKSPEADLFEGDPESVARRAAMRERIGEAHAEFAKADDLRFEKLLEGLTAEQQAGLRAERAENISA